MLPEGIKLDIRDFGAKPNSKDDTIPAVRKALEYLKVNGRGLLHFPPGEYHFYPVNASLKEYYLSNTDIVNPRRCAILLEKIQNISIEGEYDVNAPELTTNLLFHGKICPIVIDQCESVSISNLNIDWVRPLESEGKIIAVEKNYIDVEINPKEYPFTIKHNKLDFILDDSGEPLSPPQHLRKSLLQRIAATWGSGSQLWGVMEFDEKTRAIPPKTGDSTLGWGWRRYKARQIAPNKVRLFNKFHNPPQIGHWLILRHHERDHAGMFFTQSRNVGINKINLFATGGLGILAQYCENLTFSHVQVTPNRVKRMFVAGRDDGFHFSNCRGQITVEACAFEGLMDDPMNVHGTSVKIMEIKPPSSAIKLQTIRAQFVHPQSAGMPWAQPGDVVGFINRQTMQTIGRAKVKAFRVRSIQNFEVDFESSIPEGVSANDAMENLSWIPDLTFRNCQVLSCRARGILISTSGKVLIEKNYFKSSGSPILIAGDANNWWESGAVKNVIIRENDFSDFCLANIYGDCEAIISISPVIPSLDYKTPFHRNIIIERNQFHPFDYPVLYAKSTENLVFRDNIIERSTRYPPYHHRKATISLIACANVQIEKNQLIGNVLGKNIQIEKMPTSEVHCHENEPLKPISK